MFDGVEISTPAGSAVTISEAKVWWYVPQETSGATTFAIAAATGGTVSEYATPMDYRSSSGCARASILLDVAHPRRLLRKR